MSQSSTIAATLLAAFVLFLAARGRLNTYTAVLWGNTSAPKPTGGGGGGEKSDELIPGSGDLGEIAMTAAMFI